MLLKLLNGGLKSGQWPEEKKKIILLNKIAIVFILGVGIKLLNELYVFDTNGIIITASLICSILVVIFLNHNGKTNQARFIFLSVNTLFLFIINILYGKGFGIEFMLFPMVMFVVLYLDKTVSKLFWLMTFAVAYFSSLYFLNYNPPLKIEDLDPQSFYYMLAISIAVVFFMTSLFIEENETFVKKTSLLLNELSNKNKELENANIEVEQFAFIASHDLKTPLRNISSFLKLIEHKIHLGNTQDIQEYLDFASLNARRMQNLVQDIQTFSDANTDTVPVQNIDLNKVVNRVIINLEDLIKQSGAEIKIDDLPTIDGNQAQLMILFQNLIENGLKYNSSNSPFIQIKAKETEVYHEILIRDNGIGIPKEYREKVFDMFYKLQYKEDFSGAGIGLARCKKIAAFHDGNISILSSDETGTTFKLELPKVNRKVKLDKKRKNRIDKSLNLQL